MGSIYASWTQISQANVLNRRIFGLLVYQSETMDGQGRRKGRMPCCRLLKVPLGKEKRVTDAKGNNTGKIIRTPTHNVLD